MKFNKNQLISGGIGVLLGAGSVLGIESVSKEDSFSSSLFNSSVQRKEVTMYEKVNTDLNGDVYITPNGKKYHNEWCYTLQNADEIKQVSRSSAINVGYKPCKKCKP